MTEHDQLIADALRLIGRTIAALTEMEKKLEMVRDGGRVRRKPTIPLGPPAIPPYTASADQDW